MPIADILENNNELRPLLELIDQIMEIPDENLNDEGIKMMTDMFDQNITPVMREAAAQSMANVLISQGYSQEGAKVIIDNTKTQFDNYLNSINPSPAKRQILDHLFSILYEIFDGGAAHLAVNKITLNLTLEENAHVPTYAHDSDAAADLYAMEDQIIPAHSLSNRIHTGVHIQLPQNWMAMIVPRSSIGAKTGLRLSNSIGIIDEQYLGELGVLYDNVSDSDYTIHAGDRIAQMLIFPSYHFQANVVSELVPTERGEGGFGSSGK